MIKVYDDDDLLYSQCFLQLLIFPIDLSLGDWIATKRYPRKYNSESKLTSFTSQVLKAAAHAFAYHASFLIDDA